MNDIRGMREALGLTQQELAEMMGRDVSTISRAERGIHKSTRSSYVIANFLRSQQGNEIASNMSVMRQMRIDYGVSLEQMADALDLTVDEVDRLEGGSLLHRAITSTKFGQIVCAIGNCNGNVSARYARYLAPNKLLKEIEHDPAYTQLVYGPMLNLVAASEGTLKRWPMCKRYIGSNAEPLLTGDKRRFYKRYTERIDDLLAGSTTTVKFVSRFDVAFGNRFYDNGYYSQTLKFPEPGFVILTSVDCTKQEYEFRRENVEFID